MKKESYKLFPTLINKYRYAISESQRKDIANYCHSINGDLKNHGELLENGKTNFELNGKFIEKISAEISSCLNLKNQILECVNDYIDQIGIEKLQITNSWFNIQRKGSALKQHIHPLSVLSGVLFLEADRQSSKIYFENPNKLVKYFSQYSKPSEFNFEHYYFEPEPCSLILFPSWLSHGSMYEINESDSRIVLSFNTSHQ
jgi:uncharacterized protein (TIGR02466 family)